MSGKRSARGMHISNRVPCFVLHARAPKRNDPIQNVGWVQQSGTHQPARPDRTGGFRFAAPTLHMFLPTIPRVNGCRARNRNRDQPRELTSCELIEEDDPFQENDAGMRGQVDCDYDYEHEHEARTDRSRETVLPGCWYMLRRLDIMSAERVRRAAMLLRRRCSRASSGECGL